MKIAEVSATFPPYNAGTGNVCYHNSLELKKLGHDVTVYTGRRSNLEKENSKSLSVKYLKPLFTVGNAPFLPQLLKLKDYDIVHLHYPFFFGAELVYLNSIIRNSKYVLTYHNDAISNGLYGLFFNIYSNTIQKLILGRADKIFIPSLDYAQNSYLSKIFRDNPQKIIEIPNGVDSGKFNPSNEGSFIKQKYSLNNKKIILFVGALDKAHYFKGVDILLESMKYVCNQNYHLIIVGEGELKESYINKIDELGLNSYVTFAGKVSDEELPLYYAASDVTVLPSIGVESFGLVLIEAMATGKPVIASNLPGVRSVVDDGKNGFLVIPKDSKDLASKINKILNNGELASRFGINGRKKIEEMYSWGKVTKKLEQQMSFLIRRDGNWEK